MAALMASPALASGPTVKALNLMESYAEVLGRLVLLQPPAMAALVDGQMEAQQRWAGAGWRRCCWVAVMLAVLLGRQVACRLSDHSCPACKLGPGRRHQSWQAAPELAGAAHPTRAAGSCSAGWT